MATDKSQGKQHAGWLRPGVLVLATSLLWLAAHEPVNFNAASLPAWLLGGATAALLTRAALALAMPAITLAGALFNRLSRNGTES